jgi:hypothetical protein
LITGLFEIVVAGAVQSIFYLEIYQNDIFFYFLKIIFKISISKRSKNIKKNLNFLQIRVRLYFQIVPPAHAKTCSSLENKVHGKEQF